MPTFEQGDVVRVPFPYTDRTTRQRRPAVVISSGNVGDEGLLLWVLMVTSAENRRWPADVPFGPDYRSAGLPAPSIVRTAKIATIEASAAERVGRVGPDMLATIKETVNSLI